MIAALILISIALAGTTYYSRVQLNEYRIEAEFQKLKLAEVKKDQKDSLEKAHQNYKSDINILNSSIKRLREQTSLLPSFPNPTETLCFSKEKLDTALRDYREEVLSSIGTGDSYRVEVETLEDWLQEQKYIN